MTNEKVASSENLKRVGAVIFDFDGVLADTEATALRVVERVAKKKKVPVPTKDFLKNHTSQETLKALGLRWWEIPYFASLSRKWAAEEDPVMRLFPFAADLLRSAQKHARQVWIVSSNSEDAILRAFKNAGILFPESQIRARISIFGKSSVLKKLLKKEKLLAHHSCYVGDETRDMEAARRVGLISVAVGWGFHSPELLRTRKPDHLLLGPHEFEPALQKILD